MSEEKPDPGRSFGAVAEAYDRARPAYPDEAIPWLVGTERQVVLELGAGTGKLTSMLRGHGHKLLATDPLPEMLTVLARNVGVPHVAASAELIPVRSRSVDVVVCAQSFHWFDPDVALAEIARVLRPGGTISLVWNTYDVGIPWVRRLKQLISPAESEATMPLMATPHFGFVEQAEFRFWQNHNASTLADLARSVSHVSGMSEADRGEVLARVDALYADYGRGHDGMRLPWITRCYRAVVRHQEAAPPEIPAQASRASVRPETAEVEPEAVAPAPRRPPDDPGMQLIDFR